MTRQSRSPALILVAGALLAVACNEDPASPPAEDPLVSAMKNATTAYQDIDAATAAGFVEVSPCVASPAGGMGFHYANQSLVDEVIDATAPEVLLYEPTPTGMVLVGVEFLVLADAWDAVSTALPELDGEPFADHRDPAARHGLPFGHYDLHAWVWRTNPDGMWAPFHPQVSCASASPSVGTPLHASAH